MLRDAETLISVENGEKPPTLRFFRFREPTMSYGRLQKHEDVEPLRPEGWAIVQRPTGGGVVFHREDLCFSLCWKPSDAPLPDRPQDQYRWIHSVVLGALKDDVRLHMAACCDVSKSDDPFAVRTCFQNPVGYDLLENSKKILGGALRCTRRATLYQGSLQMIDFPGLDVRLMSAFKILLTPGAV